MHFDLPQHGVVITSYSRALLFSVVAGSWQEYVPSAFRMMQSDSTPNTRKPKCSARAPSWSITPFYSCFCAIQPISHQNSPVLQLEASTAAAAVVAGRGVQSSQTETKHYCASDGMFVSCTSVRTSICVCLPSHGPNPKLGLKHSASIKRCFSGLGGSARGSSPRPR